MRDRQGRFGGRILLIEYVNTKEASRGGQAANAYTHMSRGERSGCSEYEMVCVMVR
jgi:hypothetical protein